MKSSKLGLGISEMLDRIMQDEEKKKKQQPPEKDKKKKTVFVYNHHSIPMTENCSPGPSFGPANYDPNRRGPYPTYPIPIAQSGGPPGMPYGGNGMPQNQMHNVPPVGPNLIHPHNMSVGPSGRPSNQIPNPMPPQTKEMFNYDGPGRPLEPPNNHSNMMAMGQSHNRHIYPTEYPLNTNDYQNFNQIPPNMPPSNQFPIHQQPCHQNNMNGPSPVPQPPSSQPAYFAAPLMSLPLSNPSESNVDMNVPCSIKNRKQDKEKKSKYSNSSSIGMSITSSLPPPPTPPKLIAHKKPHSPPPSSHSPPSGHAPPPSRHASHRVSRRSSSSHRSSSPKHHTSQHSSSPIHHKSERSSSPIHHKSERSSSPIHHKSERSSSPQHHRKRNHHHPPHRFTPPLPSSPPPELPPPPPSPSVERPMSKPPEPKEPPPESPLKSDHDMESEAKHHHRKSIRKERRRTSRHEKYDDSISGDESPEMKHSRPSSSSSRPQMKRNSEKHMRSDWQRGPGVKHFIPNTPPGFVANGNNFKYRGKGHFNHMGGGGGPPFGPRAGGRPPFRPYNNRGVMRGGPHFPRGRGGPPPFSSRAEGPPFCPMNNEPPFNPMGGGPPPFDPMGDRSPPFMGHRISFSEKGGAPKYLKEGFDSFYEDQNQYDSDYEYSQNVKHTKETKRVKKVKRRKSSREKDVEHKTDIKFTKNVKHTKEVKQTKVKRTRDKEDILPKSKKTKVDYELEPGEYVSDSDLEDVSESEKSESKYETGEESSHDSKSDSSSSEDSLDRDRPPSPDFKKFYHSKASKLQTYGSDLESEGEVEDDLNSIQIKERPKFPRYFKDKVAFIAEPLIMQEEENGEENKVDSKISKELPIIVRKKADEFLETTKLISSPILSESLKPTKTPLIKRLGLAGEELQGEEDKLGKYNEIDTKSHLQDHRCKSTEKSFNDERKSDYAMSSTRLHEHELFSNRENSNKFKRRRYSSHSDDSDRENRSNSLSPSNSLDSEEFRLLASTKEILSASKSIFKSPTSPKVKTTKKRYEKPIIKVETVSKPEILRKVKESPNRIDLDSRIKIIFGMKSSGEENSPEKKNFRNHFNHKNMRLLSRPPSPFRSRNAYHFWHKETYYFRKNNIMLEEFSDPTVRRKIGIQIKKDNSIDIRKDNSIDIKPDQDLRLDDFPLPISINPPVPVVSEPSSMELVADLPKKLFLEKDMALEEDLNFLIKAELSQLPFTSPENEQLNKSINDADNISSLNNNNNITKVNVFPDSEMELISEQECDKDEPSLSSSIISEVTQSITGDISDVSKNNVIQLVLQRIIDELKNTIKDKLTEDLIDDQINS